MVDCSEFVDGKSLGFKCAVRIPTRDPVCQAVAHACVLELLPHVNPKRKRGNVVIASLTLFDVAIFDPIQLVWMVEKMVS
ncbi:MAG TPA: hypothetical protein VG125_00420 [Pirellulales bacterium]|jgi:hypothetical protein|nr:hypothetical protein [Pirellulales bacterium]